MIEVAVGKQWNGATFQLTPKTETHVEARFPGWSPVPSSVFLSSSRHDGTSSVCRTRCGLRSSCS